MDLFIKKLVEGACCESVSHTHTLSLVFVFEQKQDKCERTQPSESENVLSICVSEVCGKAKRRCTKQQANNLLVLIWDINERRRDAW